MIIGIDGRPFEGKRTGVGRYVYELCKELDKLLPQAKFYVYSRQPIELPIKSNRWIARIEKNKIMKRVKSAIWLKMRCSHYCEADNLNVFWGTASFLPTLPKHVRKILTVYDLNLKLVPETMGTTHRIAHYLFFSKDLKRADHVSAISKGTSNHLKHYFGREADSIVYPSVDHTKFYPRGIHEAQECLNEYGIKSPYILAVGTWEPRKNLERLIQAFIALEKSSLTEYKLVLVGGRGWKDEKLARLIQGIGKNIIPLGYVPDEKMPYLYSQAHAFVFPSIYEGFGIPVLEARACGAPVVTSDIPELREAGGESALYIQPTVDGIKTGISNILKYAIQCDYSAKPMYSWRESAETLVKAFLK